MKNVIVINDIDFSGAGLGQFTVLNLGTPVPGFLKRDGTLENTLSAWNNRMRTSELVAIPEGATAITGLTNEVRYGSSRTLIPVLCYYDESEHFISADNSITIQDEYIEQSVIEIYLGILNSNIPNGAKYFRICWCTTYNAAAADVLIPATGPEIRSN